MESSYPTINDILAMSRAHNLDISFQSVRPFFRVTVRNTDTRTELGKAERLTRACTRGKVLHLDSLKLRRESLGVKCSETGCQKAELLAINDSDRYHSKLVRLCGRIGFKAVHKVTSGTTDDLAHMLVCGGVGTRMDADVEHLLGK